jgi:predicted SnoaL-like aldol condensation-catalyzing enzyme
MSNNTTTRSAVDVVVASIKALEDLDLDAIRATTHPEAINREASAEPLPCRQPGPDGFHATAEWLHNLAADISWDIHEAIADGDLVAVHATMCGHQSNPHTIYAPDGQPAQVMPNHGLRFAVTQTHWFRLRDGLVIEHWANRDDLGMAAQLGWLIP